MNARWKAIRQLDGSQAIAFEEFCCQLARRSHLVHPARFRRKGTPDSGVECWTWDEAGNETAWQAKFFDFPLGNSQWSQLDNSVNAALRGHPKLVRYVVCLPGDLPDARQEGQASAQGRWDSRVERWRQWAAEKGMDVEFEYWGSSELEAILQHDENRGLAWYWFHDEALTPAWLRSRWEEAAASAGPRYNPDLNVEVPTKGWLEVVVRGEPYQQALRVLAAAGEVAVPRMTSFLDVPLLATKVARIVEAGRRAISTLRELGEDPYRSIDAESAAAIVTDLRDAYWEMSSACRDGDDHPRWSHEADNSDLGDQGPPRETWTFIGHAMAELRPWMSDVAEEALSDQHAELASSRQMLLVGEAGIGKTHLLCDFVKECLARKQPALLVSGEHIPGQDTLKSIMDYFDVGCETFDEFLGALEAAAEAHGSRGILVIDALNETTPYTIWRTQLPRLVERLKRFPRLSLIVSIRDDYVRAISQDVPAIARLPQVRHDGFSDVDVREFAAFFEFYGLRLPSIPLLDPEFHNPLFLKISCQTLQARGLTSGEVAAVPLSELFRAWFDALNDKLSTPDRLNYDSAEKRVELAVGRLSRAMAEHRESHLPRAEAKRIVEAIHPGSGWEDSLLRRLLSEGVIAETIEYSRGEGDRDVIRFSYDRLSNYAIAEALLDTHPPNTHGQWPFDEASLTCAWLTNRRESPWGLVVALSNLVPERTGVDFIRCHPRLEANPWTLAALIEGAPWRKPESITGETTSIIEKALDEADRSTRRLIYETLLATGVRPKHPLGSEFLHSQLMKLNIATRDGTWGIALHDSLQAGGMVARLLDWTERGSSPNETASPYRDAVGTCLAWMLSSATRSIRDRATKALVRLYDGQVEAINSLRQSMADSADPYVIERVLAAVLGVALRANDEEALQRVAGSVYDDYFDDGRPHAHLLIREYARSIVERAANARPANWEHRQGWRPPYRSEFPDIPPLDDLPHRGYPAQDAPVAERARGDIHSSVMSHGDFARYIIGTDHRGPWLDIPLDEGLPPTHEERYERFRAQLNEEALHQLDAFAQAREQYLAIELKRVRIAMWSPEEEGGKKVLEVGEEASDEGRAEYDQNLASAEIKMNQALADLRDVLDDATAARLEIEVLPHLSGKRDEYPHLGLDVLQRYIYWRVFDLGWSAELHGDFDYEINRAQWSGHRAGLGERIGKKYQWIGYHEITAFLSDRYVFREDGQPFRGAWQLSARDIDPSALWTDDSFASTWTGSRTWPPTDIGDWRSSMDLDAWLDDIDDLPNPGSTIRFHDGSGRSWLNMGGDYVWRQPLSPEEEALDQIRRDAFYLLRGYLVPRANYGDVIAWAKTQDFSGRWMPEFHDLYGVFLGEFGWGEAYRYHRGEAWNYDEWEKPGKGQDEGPCEILVPLDSYSSERRGDASQEGASTALTPSPAFAKLLGLSWCGVGSRFRQETGVEVAFDPGYGSDAPSGFLVDEEALDRVLQAQDLQVFWIIQCEKNAYSMKGLMEDLPPRQNVSMVVERLPDGTFQTTRQAKRW